MAPRYPRGARGASGGSCSALLALRGGLRVQQPPWLGSASLAHPSLTNPPGGLLSTLTQTHTHTSKKKKKRARKRAQYPNFCNICNRKRRSAEAQLGPIPSWISAPTAPVPWRLWGWENGVPHKGWRRRRRKEELKRGRKKEEGGRDQLLCWLLLLFFPPPSFLPSPPPLLFVNLGCCVCVVLCVQLYTRQC